MCRYTYLESQGKLSSYVCKRDCHEKSNLHLCFFFIWSNNIYHLRWGWMFSWRLDCKLRKGGRNCSLEICFWQNFFFVNTLSKSGLWHDCYGYSMVLSKSNNNIQNMRKWPVFRATSVDIPFVISALMELLCMPIAYPIQGL